MKNVTFYHTAAEARSVLGLPECPADRDVEKRYPVLLNSYYLNLIDPSQGESDPIFRQCLPDAAEIADDSSSCDPLDEVEQSPVPRLIRRYFDRAVLLTTGKCAMRCRFCFRKRGWTCGTEFTDISDEELQLVAEYLKRTPEIREVLVSGGDPLFLPYARLKKILETLQSVPSIEILRLGSRLPAVLPAAVTDDKIELMASCETLWLATHFNHPREVTPEASALCRRIVAHGIPMVNQTVLLKGVNDKAEILEELFRKLIRCKVKPLYLFHVDPVRGVRHFATGIEKGLEILRAFRPRLSSLAVPAFAIDLPEGGGKVTLQPEYRRDPSQNVFPDIHYTKEIPYQLIF